MPYRKILSKAELNKKYPEEEYIKSNISEIRQLYMGMIRESNQLDNQILQAIYLFSIIDCFAQAYADYPVYNSQKHFCDFVNEFQKNKYPYLMEIEPITLFYDIEEEIDEVVKHPELAIIRPEIIKERPYLLEPRKEIT